MIRICPVCLITENYPEHRKYVLCRHCLALGHTYEMLAAGDFAQSRTIWATHVIPEVVAIAHAALDKAEQRLAEAELQQEYRGDDGDTYTDLRTSMYGA